MWIRIKTQMINLNHVKSILVGDDQISFEFAQSSDPEKTSVTYRRGTALPDNEYDKLLKFIQSSIQTTTVI